LFLDWINERSPSEYFLITKNGKEFDIPFIFIRYYENSQDCDRNINIFTDNKGYEHLDLQDLTEKRISLQSMAQLLGCTPKSGTGVNAIKLWNEGRFGELKEYCMQDVDTTEEVFQKWKGMHH
jgi:predicted PolB exonuclease-like 3'-5' exonuclease